jgi:hypothetical protein
MGFWFDDRIYWTFIQALHKSLFHLFPTGHSTGTILTSNWTESSAQLDSTITHCDSSLLHTVVLITSRHGPHRKYRSQQYPALPRDGRLLLLTASSWNAFTEPLPSNGSIFHNILIRLNLSTLQSRHRFLDALFLKCFKNRLSCSPIVHIVSLRVLTSSIGEFSNFDVRHRSNVRPSDRYVFLRQISPADTLIF